VGTTDIFLGFEKFGKAFGLMVFQSIFIALWTCLFVVPGIIAAIRYSQAFFVLADDPTKSIRQCMNESKIMMKGNKAKYFCLTLSFFGWAFLSLIPASVFKSVMFKLGVCSLPNAIVTVIGLLFIVPVIMYIWSTYAGFYEILAGHLIKETEPAPIEPEAIPTTYADAETTAEATESVEPAVSNGTVEAAASAEKTAFMKSTAASIPVAETMSDSAEVFDTADGSDPTAVPTELQEGQSEEGASDENAPQ